MAPAGGADSSGGKRSILERGVGVARRRKWAIVSSAAVLPLALVLLSQWRGPVYQASTRVLVDEQLRPTEADLARVREVVTRTVRAAGRGDRSVEDFVDASSVAASDDSRVLVFSVKDPVEPVAIRLANEYARQYTSYRNELDALRGSNAVVVEAAEDAERVGPRLAPAALLGVLLGLGLGVGLALVWETLDARLRSAEEFARHVGLGLLGSLRIRGEELPNLNSLLRTSGVNGEAARQAAVNLEVARSGVGARVLLFTSGSHEEARSTIAAELAAALARNGRRVALVDLDFEQPRVSRLFGLEGRPGLPSVLLGEAPLEEALATALSAPSRRPVRRPRPEPDLPGGVLAELLAIRSGGLRVSAAEPLPEADGTLDVLPAGPTASDATLVGSEALTGVLAELRERAELVLLVGPPLSSLEQALSVSARADGVVLVSHLPKVDRRRAAEVRRALDLLPTPSLGVVATAPRSATASVRVPLGRRLLGTARVPLGIALRKGR